VAPPVVLAGADDVFTVVVPTEKDDVSTTKVELTPPEGFSIDSLAPSPGWSQSVQRTGSGEEAVIEKVTWDGGDVPTDEAAFLQFFGSADSGKTYAFAVRQTYSDGSVVDWSGAESSDTPTPTIEAKDSFGGGGGSSTLAIIALIVGAVGLLVGVVAIMTGGGRRTLA
jgi:uncharacterized protein YcnI